jgi:hypothetical protein
MAQSMPLSVHKKEQNVVKVPLKQAIKPFIQIDIRILWINSRKKQQDWHTSRGYYRVKLMAERPAKPIKLHPELSHQPLSIACSAMMTKIKKISASAVYCLLENKGILTIIII